MGRSIVTLALVVAFAVLVALNIGFTTSVSLFGNRLDDVPVVSVAARSLAVGVVCSRIFFIGRSLRRRQVRGLAGDTRASKSSFAAAARFSRDSAMHSDDGRDARADGSSCRSPWTCLRILSTFGR